MCKKTRILQSKKPVKKIFTLLAEATIKTATKDKMCNSYFQSKASISLLMSFVVTTLAINSLLQATVIVFKKFSLNHPFSTVALSLFNADGSVRQTVKNKLAQILKSKSNETNTEASKGKAIYVDLMVMMRVVTAIPETFKDLALKLMSILPT